MGQFRSIQSPFLLLSNSMITIYHNPRCSKSRAALLMVEQFATAHGLPIEVVDYLKTPPSIEQLTALQRQLGTDARAMVRDNEAEYAALGLAQADDTALLEAIVGCPTLLQRPIVVYRDRAMIGRPPERLTALLQATPA